VVTAGLLDNEVLADDIVLGPRPTYNQKDINRQFTKMSWESHDPRGLAAMLRRAFKVALTEPGGPVYLAIPNTVLEDNGPPSSKGVATDIYDREHFLIPNDIPPAKERIEQTLRTLAPYDAFRWAEDLFEHRDYYSAAIVLQHLVDTHPDERDLASARELLAVSAWRNKDAAAARQWIEAISTDAQTPQSLRTRVEALQALLPQSATS